MSNTFFSPTNESTGPADTHQAPCSEMSFLFTRLITGLAGAIARIGGKPLADQFEEQVDRYAGQHGWSVLTGLTDLSELRHKVPDVEPKILLSVYLSYAQYARSLAGKVLGEQMLRSTLSVLVANLPPLTRQFNDRHGIIRVT